MIRSIGAIKLMLLISGCSHGQSFEAKKFYKELKGDVQLVDVRTPEEFASGHLTNALLMNVNEDGFESNLNRLDKTKPIYLYCRSGKRSHTAAAIMKGHGFKQI